VVVEYLEGLVFFGFIMVDFVVGGLAGLVWYLVVVVGGGLILGSGRVCAWSGVIF